MITRRHFIGAATTAAISRRAAAQATGGPRLRFAVMGINHEHIFRMVQAVRDGGGELAMSGWPARRTKIDRSHEEAGCPLP